MKPFCFFIVAALIASCGGEPREIVDASHDPLSAFNDFPDSVFLGLYFDQHINDSRKNIEQNNFELLDSSGSWSYLNEKDSIEIILPSKEKLHSFKLILRSNKILESVDLLHSLFGKQATSIDRSSIFSVYNYDQKTPSFKVSMFEQEDFIRLQFEQRAVK